MSTKFTQQSLNLILNATKKKNTEKTIDKRKPKTTVTRLPDTKQGLKKIRHEIRYGRHERAKQQKELQQKKEYVLGKFQSGNGYKQRRTHHEGHRCLKTRGESSRGQPAEEYQTVEYVEAQVDRKWKSCACIGKGERRRIEALGVTCQGSWLFGIIYLLAGITEAYCLIRHPLTTQTLWYNYISTYVQHVLYIQLGISCNPPFHFECLRLPCQKCFTSSLTACMGAQREHKKKK